MRKDDLNKESQGVIGIFGQEAQEHDTEVYTNSIRVKKLLEKEFPMFEFRYRKKLLKKEINEALRKVDPELGQTLFVENANIKPDGGLIEVKKTVLCVIVI